MSKKKYQAPQLKELGTVAAIEPSLVPPIGNPEPGSSLSTKELVVRMIGLANELKSTAEVAAFRFAESMTPTEAQAETVPMTPALAARCWSLAGSLKVCAPGDTIIGFQTADGKERFGLSHFEWRMLTQAQGGFTRPVAKLLEMLLDWLDKQVVGERSAPSVDNPWPDPTAPLRTTEEVLAGKEWVSRMPAEEAARDMAQFQEKRERDPLFNEEITKAIGVALNAVPLHRERRDAEAAPVPNDPIIPPAGAKALADYVERKDPVAPELSTRNNDQGVSVAQIGLNKEGVAISARVLGPENVIEPAPFADQAGVDAVALLAPKSIPSVPDLSFDAASPEQQGPSFVAGEVRGGEELSSRASAHTNRPLPLTEATMARLRAKVNELNERAS
jgi:hypothetical protein